MDRREVPPWIKHIWDELTRPPAILQQKRTTQANRAGNRPTPDEESGPEEEEDTSRKIHAGRPGADLFRKRSSHTRTRSVRDSAGSAWQSVRDLFESPTDPPTVPKVPATTASSAARITRKYFVPKRTQKGPSTKPRPRAKLKTKVATRTSTPTSKLRRAEQQPSAYPAIQTTSTALPLAMQTISLRVRETLDCKIVETQAVDAVWRIVTDKDNVYALKVTSLTPSRIVFMADALDEVYKRGFTPIARIIRTRTGEPYWLDGKQVYYLSEWLSGTRPQFASTRQVGAVARATARLHEISRRYDPLGEQPPSAFAVFEHLLSRKQDLQHILQQLEKSALLDEYDEIALRLLTKANQQASDALSLIKLPEAEQQLALSESDPGLCHLDVTRGNLIMHPSGHAQLIDFDRMAFGPRVLDLAHLIRRAMQAHGTWTSEIAIAPLLAYNRVRPLSQGEYLLLEALLTFPHRLWRLLRTYYEDPPNQESQQKKALELLRDLQTMEEERAKFLDTFARQVTRRTRRS